MNMIEKLLLTHIEPVKLAMDTIGSMWATYFLWNHELYYSLAFLLGFTLLGTFLAWNTDYKKASKTWFGKLLLLHARPINMALHILGFVPLVYGIWMHSTVYILVGVSIILLGHVKRASDLFA